MSRNYLYPSVVVLVAIMVSIAYWFSPDTTKNSEDANTPQPRVTGEPVKSSQPAATSYLAARATHIGSQSCAGCHIAQYEAWQGSHHELAMLEASSETVLGNFNNASFSDEFIESLFFTRDDSFYIRSKGIDGELTDFLVTHTFGSEPLQQYIVSFPGGRRQVFPVAWDTQKNEWFFLQADLKPAAGEWVHWTRGAMNWNGMCADCHSTGVKKNYSIKNDTYKTTFTEVNVGCESCHGPGSLHLQAVSEGQAAGENKNLYIDMSTAEEAHNLVDKCGRCHSRRQQLTSEYRYHGSDMLDHYLPAVLRSDLYHGDGQINEEVFVYGSYLQSRKYQYGVDCRNCHDPHSARLKQQGNNLCTACHSAQVYDVGEHHHHAEADIDEAGIQCIDCHMPGKYYMVRDFRRDHSFRVPRPDLSEKYGTPNACQHCHATESNSWASTAINKWFGEKRRDHYSDLLLASSPGEGAEILPLLALIEDQQQPEIVRATAVNNLSPFIHLPEVGRAIAGKLASKSSLVRSYAATAVSAMPLAARQQLLFPLLDDAVRAVRISAAAGLQETDPASLPAKLRTQYVSAMSEYQASLAQNADIPSGRYQLALAYHRQGQFAQAETGYQETLKLDDHFNAARLNLAQLYYQQQRLEEVESVYLEVIDQEPASDHAYYSLGLLYAEQGKLDKAKSYLEQAAGKGNNPRAWYNLAVLHHQQQDTEMAEEFYVKALSASPLEPDFLQGIYSLYAQQQQWSKLEKLIDDSLLFAPRNQQLLELRRSVNQQLLNQSPR